MISEQDENIKQIETLLTLLPESMGIDAKKALFQKLLATIPFGHHPLRYIEFVNNPDLRCHLRQNFGSTLNELKLIYDWKTIITRDRENLSLDQSVFLVSRLGQDSDLLPEEFSAKLDEMSFPLMTELSLMDQEDHTGRITALRRYIFEDMGFKGDTDNYYSPENSFLTYVLDNKRGIPVSLSVLVLLIAWRVGLPMYGINLPGHFIVKYYSEDYRIYMDPFNKGNLLTEDECFQFLSWQGLEPLPAYLSTAGVPAIIIRMYRNLINYYSQPGNERVEKTLRQHYNLLQEVYLNS